MLNQLQNRIVIKKTLLYIALTVAFAALVFFALDPNFTFAASAGEVKSKLNSAGNTIKGVLTGIVSIVGICVALFIIVKRMPSADDPHEKAEVYKAVGRVLGLVALAAAIIWVVPWVYSLLA